jgi:hypothetical protein
MSGPLGEQIVGLDPTIYTDGGGAVIRTTGTKIPEEKSPKRPGKQPKKNTTANQRLSK